MSISQNTLDVLQDAPQPNMQPDEFNLKAFAFAAVLYTLGLEINETVATLNQESTTSESGDTLTIGLGAKNLTVEAGKSFAVGMSVRIADTLTGTRWMNGDVTAYDPGTGNLSVNVSAIQGSGNANVWTISQSFGGLTAGSVDTDKLAGLAVTTAKIADEAITADKVADAAISLEKLADDVQKSLSLLTASGTGTFTMVSNRLVLTGIVPTLGLEVGDVINITGAASSGGINNGARTVESIIDDDSIVLNYEHRNGNGVLSFVDETATITVKLLAKWNEAPPGLGQAWVDVSAVRVAGTTYTNTTKRGVQVSILIPASNYNIVINGKLVGIASGLSQTSHSPFIPVDRGIIVSGYTAGYWSELR